MSEFFPEYKENPLQPLFLEYLLNFGKISGYFCMVLFVLCVEISDCQGFTLNV